MVTLLKQLFAFSLSFALLDRMVSNFAKRKVSREQTICPCAAERLSSSRPAAAWCPYKPFLSHVPRSRAGLLAGGDSLHPEAAGAAPSSPEQSRAGEP